MKLNIKKLLLLALFSGPFNFLLATEGMWIPSLLSGLLESDMQSMGMELTAEDIYSINQGSLKDAIVNFGGCTGSMISPEGLLLTNHHCGYSFIQKHSSVENDLLSNGFWAQTKSDELPNPGLKVHFVKRIDDVTNQILGQLEPGMNELLREEKIRKIQEELAKKTADETGYEVIIRPFYYGNAFYMFTVEVFTDVRLVAAPPSSIGKFGGETDNWMWPRHTGDFSLFRIYTAPDGSPADYAPENVPYQPGYYLPVSLDGIQPGDFTMVFGFPGRTEEYLTASAIRQTVDVINPHRIDIREKKLAILAETMKQSDALRIRYAADYARIANYYKKWQGENWGLKKYDALAKKELNEARFMEWLQENPARKAKYGNLYRQLDSTYRIKEKPLLYWNYLNEAILGVESIRFVRRISSELGNQDKEIDQWLKNFQGHFNNLDIETDRSLFLSMLDAFVKNMDSAYQPAYLKETLQKYNQDLEKWAEEVYNDSYFTSKERFEDLTTSRKKQIKQKIENDPLYKLTESFIDFYRAEVMPSLVQIDQQQGAYYRHYIQGLQEMYENARFYPDANGTMRLAYGKVAGCIPEDGMAYHYQTTLEGIIEKEDLDNPEFMVPERLKQLYLTKDYGPYGDELTGTMPVCFLASNHTTGGNSGSPVINGKGELIGLNFDRSWESTMSDMNYDPEICRNISVDIRYVLFIIDKFGNAGHLVDEMLLVDEEAVLENR